MLYKHTHENKLRKLLQIMSGSILRRCIDWENDELTIELLSIQIFAQQELNELLKFAQKQDNTTLTAAVLNALADCNDTSDFIILHLPADFCREFVLQKKRSGDTLTTSFCCLEKHHLTALAFKKQILNIDFFNIISFLLYFRLVF